AHSRRALHRHQAAGHVSAVGGHAERPGLVQPPRGRSAAGGERRMSILQSLSIKPLLYVIAALALFLLLSNLGWWVHASSLDLRADVAEANKDSALAVLDARTAERDAWKNK